MTAPVVLSAAMAKEILSGRPGEAAVAAMRDLAAGRTVCVPAEATEQMVKAGYQEITVDIECDGNDLFNAYRAMLAASQPKEPPHD